MKASEWIRMLAILIDEHGDKDVLMPSEHQSVPENSCMPTFIPSEDCFIPIRYVYNNGSGDLISNLELASDFQVENQFQNIQYLIKKTKTLRIFNPRSNNDRSRSRGRPRQEDAPPDPLAQ